MRRRTVLALAKLADASFAYSNYPGSGMRPVHHERVDWFSEFLFEFDFSDMIVDQARKEIPQYGAVKKFVIDMWQLSRSYDPTLTTEQFFAKLAAALLERSERPKEEILIVPGSNFVEAAKRELELDGYRWSNGRLVRHEENVFDVADQEGALVELYASLGLDELDQIKHDLKLTDDHYRDGDWGDSVKHARDVFEKVILHVARTWLADKGGLPDERPFVIRDRLRDTAFLTESEHRFVAALYGLLSAQGGHPNMSPQEAARIDRQHALTAAHFLLLRLESLRAVPPASP